MEGPGSRCKRKPGVDEEQTLLPPWSLLQTLRGVPKAAPSLTFLRYLVAAPPHRGRTPGRLGGEHDMSSGVAAFSAPPGSLAPLQVQALGCGRTLTHTLTHARAELSVRIPVTLGRWQEVSGGEAAAGNQRLAPVR